jgi:hypothetical protein
MSPMPETVLVVIAHYNARPTDNLISLLESMQTMPAGWPFAVRVVVNVALPKVLALPAHLRNVEVCYRENTGYNIGAWEYGWRQAPPYTAYLFLQDECQVARADWVAAFVRRLSAPDIGLVGECLSPDWDAPWEVLKERTKGDRFPEQLIDGQPAERIPCYFHFFSQQCISPGPRGDHLQSLVLSARRAVLEMIGGFPQGRNYGEAMAAEIGISKKVQALGLRICEVGPEPFSYIHHPQWLHRKTLGTMG